MKYAFSEPRFAGLTLALLFAFPGIFASQSAQGMQNSKETALAASIHPVELTAKPVRVKLVSGKGGRSTFPASRNVYLELSGLRAAKQPGTLFHLYLDLPEDIQPKPGNEWHIGSINFYDAVAGPDTPKDKPTLPVSIDITGVIRNLRSGQKLTSESTITVTATHSPEAGSKPMIGHIAIIAK